MRSVRDGGELFCMSTLSKKCVTKALVSKGPRMHNLSFVNIKLSFRAEAVNINETHSAPKNEWAGESVRVSEDHVASDEGSSQQGSHSQTPSSIRYWPA